MYMKDPMGIECKSMDIIEKAIGDIDFSFEEKIIVKRMIHTTGDFDYKSITIFQNNFMEEALESIKSGARIYTDTKMAFMGINKKALGKANCEIKCFIDDEEILKESKSLKTTRSACSVEKAVREDMDIFVIGNAPTALFRLLELVNEKKLKPTFIVGVPVGFVGAAESKEYLREFDLPSISTIGTKGGSNVAASIINALLYMVVGK